jgi:uncharacterized protein (TIGR00297 family)
MDLYVITVPSIVALALLALRRGFLTVRGTVSAIAVGTVVAVAHTGLFLLMAFFFLSSSLLTRVRAEWKRAMGLKDVAGRSLRQVIGVGTPIAVYVALYTLTGDSRFLGAATVAVAVATADTWASEVGVAYGGRPRHVLAPWRKLDPGVSGGVTLVGERRLAGRRSCNSVSGLPIGHRWACVESGGAGLPGRGPRQRLGGYPPG